MNALLDFLRERVLLAIIAVGLLAGLIGAYGRERNEGRRPTAEWWLARICITPFFAIVSTWSASQFHLNGQQTALVASMLSIMGFEAVRLIIERGRLIGGGGRVPREEPIAPGPATPRPFATLVDTDEMGRATAHVVPVQPESPRRGAIGEGLRGLYQPTVKEAPPPDQQELLGELHRRTSDGDSHGDRIRRCVRDSEYAIAQDVGVLVTRPDARPAGDEEFVVDSFFDRAVHAQVMLNERFAIQSSSARLNEAAESQEPMRIGTDVAVAPVLPRARMIDRSRNLDRSMVIKGLAIDWQSDRNAVETVG